MESLCDSHGIRKCGLHGDPETGEAEHKRRLAFFELTDEDFKTLTALKPFAERCTHEITEGLYELIMEQPESRAFFPDAATLAHVKRMQNTYFLGLFSGNYDLNYVATDYALARRMSGSGCLRNCIWARIGRYLALINARLRDHFRGNNEEVIKAAESIRKIIFFDMAIAFDTTSPRTWNDDPPSGAIRELSTPVIKVHDRFSFCRSSGPSIRNGLIRSWKPSGPGCRTAGQGHDSRQSQEFPLSIRSGGSHHEDTAAVQLLVAQTILTESLLGARTVVQLGVRNHTNAYCSKLSRELNSH
jgi:hypothetical protein